MKKNIFLISVLCVLLLTGCGNNEQLQEEVKKEEKILTCTKNIGDDDISMIQNADIRFIDNKIEGMSSTILITLPESYKSLMSTFIDSISESYKEQYKDNNHITVTTTQQSDLEILVDINFDYKNMTEEEKQSSGFAGSQDYEVNKSSLEKSGYDCK